ncbi:hypothetical protein D3C78_1972790 [compost metagenome]
MFAQVVGYPCTQDPCSFAVNNIDLSEITQISFINKTVNLDQSFFKVRTPEIQFTSNILISSSLEIGYIS